MLAVWGLIEAIRHNLARKGNQSGIVLSLVFQIVLSLPLVVYYLYLLLLQTYVLRVDVAANAVALIFVGLQLIFSVLTVAGISIR